MPLDTSNQDIVFVGRIRPDLTDPNGLCLWCCGDQVGKAPLPTPSRSQNCW